ncbi:trypsin-like peptidase domain-containing protein [Acidisoma silvae]|uniref:Trypsin-like peptidase domain-containing protein n=2 Tax=Acidisoma silvae TaxID=2802396 RepID=A0A964DYC4_9PROT|nr:trypsin-like peptidase domain-containing protein [Acidisoma silvae]
MTSIAPLPLQPRLPAFGGGLRLSAGLTLAAALGLAAAPAMAQQGLPSFRNLVKKVVPAVVSIAVTESAAAAAADDGGDQGAPTPQAGHQKVYGAGSGFIIDPSGIIVTNDHVVGGATKITVSLADGTQLPAKILGVDQLTDIAVIKVTADRPLPYVSWGDSRQVEVGDWIMVAGNPFGLGNTVTAGIISARGRDIMSGPFDDFLQLDAPINPGNSGGPAFDLNGGVVGVDTAIISPTGGSVGIGFAIPSEIAQNVVSVLEQHGHLDRGWLGVGLADDESGDGVRVTMVQASGPAGHSGLRAGDRILSVDAKKVDTALGLIRAVAEIHPGERARLAFIRHGRVLSANVTVGLRPETQAQ